MTDPIVERVVERARNDKDTLGLLIQGSHAAGTADAESDYDLILVLTDDERARRADAGKRLHVNEELQGAELDIVYSSPARLREAAEQPGWWSPGLAASKLLLDKTGEVAELHGALCEMSADLADRTTADEFDTYVNNFYRSLKAWRRGDELAGRIEAAESVMPLVRTLFALEQRWAPYPKDLRARLPELEAQGWPSAYLETVLSRIVSTGDPTRQQELEARVEVLLRERGFGHVIEDWGGEIERVSRFRF